MAWSHSINLPVPRPPLLYFPCRWEREPGNEVDGTEMLECNPVTRPGHHVCDTKFLCKMTRSQASGARCAWQGCSVHFVSPRLSDLRSPRINKQCFRDVHMKGKGMCLVVSPRCANVNDDLWSLLHATQPAWFSCCRGRAFSSVTIKCLSKQPERWSC